MDTTKNLCQGKKIVSFSLKGKLETRKCPGCLGCKPKKEKILDIVKAPEVAGGWQGGFPS